MIIFNYSPVVPPVNFNLLDEKYFVGNKFHAALVFQTQYVCIPLCLPDFYPLSLHAHGPQREGYYRSSGFETVSQRPRAAERCQVPV